jgi:hypothetical protein
MNLSRHVFGACTLALAALLSGLGSVAFAADRGLSVSAGTDRANARWIYSALGFDGPLREPAAAQRSRPGLRAALARLVKDTQPGDRVFVYFAGHGAGSAVDAALQRSELAASVQALGRRAAQVVWVVDAPAAVQMPTFPTDGRVVVLVATRPAHTSAADARLGGLGTRALRSCLARPGFTTNPLASFGDLFDCAQRAEPVRGRPLLTIAGNDELPLQPRLTALVDPSADVAGEVAHETPLAALQRAATGADAQWHVGVADAAGSASAWSVTSDRDGFVYIVRAAADGSSLSLVYPPRPGEPNALRAGQGFEVPRTGLAAPSPSAPAATDRLMVLVSDTALRSGDLLVKLGLAHFAAAACLRNLGSDDCPSTAAGSVAAPLPLRFGAALLPAGATP